MQVNYLEFRINNKKHLGLMASVIDVVLEGAIMWMID